jgi:predicted nucleotidyltransferase
VRSLHPSTVTTPDAIDLAARVAARHPAIDLLLLFGSRARGDARETSDWDFGYLGRPGLDPDQLLADITSAISANDVDLVDLARAGGQLRFRAARDGVVVLERRAGAYEEFAIAAASFWCDAEPVLREAYERLLAEVGR